MKLKALIVVLILLAPFTARTEEPLKPGEENAHTYTVDKFADEIGTEPAEDELVRIRFNYRSNKLDDADDKESKQGTVYAKNSGKGLEVVIPPDGLGWFQQIPVQINYREVNIKSFVVFARVRTDTSGKVMVRLVGNQLQHDDFKGDSVVWH